MGQSKFRIAAYLLLLCGEASLAQDVARPSLVVGDGWAYERTDRTKKVSEGVREVKVVAKSETEYRFELRNPQTGNSVRGAADMNMNPVELNNERRVAPFRPDYAWPLSVGKKWVGTFSHVNAAGTGQFKEERSCEVAGKESLQTKAGMFEALKIVCQGKFSSPDNRGQTTLHGYTEAVYWYAPAVRRNVRIEYKDGTYNFGVWNNTLDELVSILPK